MEVASAMGIRNEYPALALRTRARVHEHSACHAPGCRNRAARGGKFCKACQSKLDRVRTQLMSAGPRGRKPSIRSSRRTASKAA